MILEDFNFGLIKFDVLLFILYSRLKIFYMKILIFLIIIL